MRVQWYHGSGTECSSSSQVSQFHDLFPEPWRNPGILSKTPREVPRVFVGESDGAEACAVGPTARSADGGPQPAPPNRALEAAEGRQQRRRMPLAARKCLWGRAVMKLVTCRPHHHALATRFREESMPVIRAFPFTVVCAFLSACHCPALATRTSRCVGVNFQGKPSATSALKWMVSSRLRNGIQAAAAASDTHFQEPRCGSCRQALPGRAPSGCCAQPQCAGNAALCGAYDSPPALPVLRPEVAAGPSNQPGIGALGC